MSNYSRPTGDEILPVTYDDNYVTVFPGEQVDIRGRVPPGGPPGALVRVSGYNSQPVVNAVRWRQHTAVD